MSRFTVNKKAYFLLLANKYSSAPGAGLSGGVVGLRAGGAHLGMAVGQPINRDRVAAKRPQSSASGDGLTSSQKTGLVLVAALCGPALLKKWYEKPASEKVDLSGFNIVTAYDTPAIERMDSTVRIEFCSS